MHRDRRQRVLGKLRTARNQLEDALKLTTSPVRNDRVVLPEAMRTGLAVMVGDLNWMLVQLEGTE